MRSICLLLICLSAQGCASLGKSANMPKTVFPEFKGKTGEATDTRYFSNARILTYEDSQLTRDRTEGVDFTVNTHVTGVNEQAKTLAFVVKTTRKDGTVELHELAFPELGEEIDYRMRSNGEVLKAGGFSPHSLFYVPSLPMPDKPVEIGDTWTMEHTWFSAKDGIPLKLDVVAILKGIVACEKGKVCADIEISGHVILVVSPSSEGAHFDSRLWGRLLFSLDRGDVIWSEMRSEEEAGVKGDNMKVTSCMVAEMKVAGDYRIPFSCEPVVRAVETIPSL